MQTYQDEDPRKAVESLFKDWGEAAKNAAKDNGIGLKEKKDPIENIIENFKALSTTRMFEFQTRIEQAPNPNSRITIGPEKDELGVPRANLHWQLTELDKRSIRRIYQIIGQQMGIAGLGRVKFNEFLRDENDNSWPEGTAGGWHHMGTTRMSDDPKKGVVTGNCQVHGINNLYVAGSGCYATSGAPNPTLTIVALSLRLSDYVKEKMASYNLDLHSKALILDRSEFDDLGVFGWV